jgi:hypothetical protein
VFKRRGSPFYYARWWVKGQEYVEITKQKNKSEAEAEKNRLVALSKGNFTIEEAFNTLLDTLARVEDADEREKNRRGFAKRLTSGAKDKLALSDGWQAWLDNPNKSRTSKNRTLLGYESIWKRFAACANKKGLEFFHEVDRSHAEAYAGDLWKSHVAPTTYNAHMKLLTNVFRVLENKASLTENVWAAITRREKTNDQGRRNLSIIGHVTTIELNLLITKSDCANGLANRFLWAVVKRSKLLPEGGNTASLDFRAIIDRLSEAVVFARQTGKLERDEEARKLWKHI